VGNTAVTARGYLCTHHDEWLNALATVLFRNIGRPVFRSYLLECVGYPGDTPTRALDSQVYRLRVKLGLNAENGMRLRTVYGLGYRMEPSSSVEPDA
jgi:DNA-binding response OmpR family regulator